MRCPRFKCECMADSCTQLGRCVVEKKAMTEQRFCTAMNRPCITKWCVNNNMCAVNKGKQMLACLAVVDDTVANYCLDPICVDTGQCQTLADEDVSDIFEDGKGWVCPSDSKPCNLVRCNGGQSCDLEQDKTSVTGTTITTYKDCHSGVHAIGQINK